MNLLVLVTDYPRPDGYIKLMYVHVRNKYYSQIGFNVTVLNFKATKKYTMDGIPVIRLQDYSPANHYDFLVCHAPNIRNHYRYLRKFEKYFTKILLFFHGHEVVRLNTVYPKPYSFNRNWDYLLIRLMQNIYDSLKLRLWRNYLPKLAPKLHLVFVSASSFQEFLKYTKISPDVLEGRYSIIHNGIGKIFEKESYNPNNKKLYDFITIRDNLDGSCYCIDLVNQTAQNNPELKFLIIGKGDFFKYTKKAENLTLINRVLSHEELIDYINQARCAIIPTRRDTQGVMACELATFGIPMITSDIPICHEILDGFVNVVFVSNVAMMNTDLRNILEKLTSRLPYEKNHRFFAENTVKNETDLLERIRDTRTPNRESPVRVLNIISNLKRGGTEQCVMNYYRNMNRSKVQYDFLVLSEENGVYEEEILEMGGRVYKIPAFLSNPIKNYIKMHAFFKTHRYAIVEIHAPSPKRYRYGLAAKRHGAERVIYHVHNNSNKKRHWFHFYAARKLNECCDYKFACSRQAGKYVYCNNDFKIIHNAINLGKYTFRAEARIALRQSMSLENKFIIGHVGRMCKQKNQGFLLKVLAEVCKIDPNAVLLLVGDGDKRPELETQVQELRLENNVIFTGVRTDIEDLLQIMDVFVFPSLWEGLGIVAVEAQAAGLPCIFADTISQEVNLSDNTRYLSLNDTHALWAEEILHFKNVPRKGNLDRIKEANYDILEQAQALAAFYQNIGGAVFADN